MEVSRLTTRRVNLHGLIWLFDKEVPVVCGEHNMAYP
jgi:hypothetical protein